MKECDFILHKAFGEGRSSLLLHEALQICQLHHIPVAPSSLLESIEDATIEANRIGYPVALKIVSPQLLHKSDIGGVILNIDNERSLEESYSNMLAEVSKKKPNAEIIGVLVQRMMPVSTELIVGGIRDPQFGPCVMLGMGGIFTEVYKDTAFRVAPIDRIDTDNMIGELKGATILEGYRGQPPADKDALDDILINVSNLMMQHSSVDQLDLNPVLTYPDSAYVVDARITLAQKQEGDLTR